MKTLMNMIFGMLLVGLLASNHGEAVASTVEAKSNDVKVLDAPSPKASVLQSLKKGESIAAGERSGMYWAVELDDKSKGYVSVMNVTRKSGSDGNLTKKIQAVVMQGREDDIGNQRTRSAVMGVRGLDESGDTAFAGNVRPNMRLVYMMEDLKVDNKKVEALGDLVYAEISQKLKR